MHNHGLPSIDEKNPFYCPNLSASKYLDSLRRHLRFKNSKPNRKSDKNTRNDRIVVSFARILDKALLANDSDDESDGYSSKQKQPSNLSTNTAILDSRNSDSTGEQTEDEDQTRTPKSLWVGMRGVPLPQQRKFSKRKRDSFSDIKGPSKYAKSIQSTHESSFDISVRREKLVYSVPGSVKYRRNPKTLNGTTEDLDAVSCHKTPRRPQNDSELLLKIRNLEDELYGPPTGTESPRGIRSLIERIDALVPGARLKERLLNLHHVSHQQIVDFLASGGYLNSRIISLFRTSEIEHISLGESLLDEDGLNISGQDVLPVFGKPNSFVFLSELSLSDTPLQDHDITYIHHLPKLSTLLLNNTAISNEAVFLLLPLKRTLTQLTLATNPNIDDDAVPAILLLSKLSFISILDTNIDMPGIRRLAKTIYHEDRVIDIEIPSACERYVDNMHEKYLLEPLPPLIVNPKLCAQLSAAALQRNLAAHAAQNPNIVTVGNKAEMAERLRALLELRKMDMLVRDMILGTENRDEEFCPSVL